MANRETLKSYLQYGDRPTESQWATLVDSFALLSELEAVKAELLILINANTAAISSNSSRITILENTVDSHGSRITTLETTSSSHTTQLANIHNLLGTSANATNLGEFTGSIFSDTSTVKAALQAIETYAESTRSQLQSNDTDIADLRTDITNLTNNLNSEIATTNTEIAAHETRISTLEATTILDSFIFACSSETGDIGTGVKSTFRMPYGFTCTEVRASLVTNTASSPVELKVLVDGTAITDQVEIAAGSTTTYQAGVPSTFLIGQNSSPVPITMDSEVKVNVLSAPTGASGLKVTLVGYVGTCSINLQGGTIAFPITFPLGTTNTLITCTG